MCHIQSSSWKCGEAEPSKDTNMRGRVNTADKDCKHAIEQSHRRMNAAIRNWRICDQEGQARAKAHRYNDERYKLANQRSFKHISRRNGWALRKGILSQFGYSGNQTRKNDRLCKKADRYMAFLSWHSAKQKQVESFLRANRHKLDQIETHTSRLT